MEQITIYSCEHIKTIHSKNGFMIAIYRAESPVALPDGTAHRQFSVKGYNLPETAGIRYNITGKFEKYAKNNRWSLSAVTIEEVMPTATDGIIMYLKTLSGVGKKRATALFDAFGADIFRVMENEPEKLKTVKGFSERSVEKMLLDYAKRKTARELFQFLYKYRIHESKIMKVHSLFGENSIHFVKDDPFILYHMAGIAFRTVDSIRSDLGYPTTFRSRLKAGICEVLKQSEFGGELFDRRNEFPSFIYDAFLPEPIYNLAFNERELYLTSGTYIPEGVCYLMFLKLLCLPISLSDFRLLAEELMREKQVFIRAEDGEIRYYRWKTAAAEYQAAKKIAQLSTQGSGKESDLNALLDEIETMLYIVERKLQMKLSLEQEQAVKMALSNKVSIITGGPGTGKTSVEKSIIHCHKLLHPEEEILLIAPTGRAAKRMTETTGVPASTIHKALGLRADDDGNLIFADADIVLHQSLIIVDEASMIGSMLLATLLRHISERARIVFIGDVDQLPSIEIGAVLREMINSCLPVMRLTQTFRQASGSNIIVNAARINTGEKRLIYDTDFQLIEKSDSKEIQDVVVEQYLKLLRKYSDDEILVLSPFRKSTETGTNSLNLRLRDVLRPDITDETPYFEKKNTRFYLGDKVMFTKNTQDLTNGDIGIITSIFKGQDGYYVTCNFNDESIELQDDELMNLELAYAMTVHKSQGAEQKAVIMVADTAHRILLKRNLLYTGITRCKSTLILVGQKEAVDIAIDTQDSVYRRTMLGTLINRYCDQLRQSGKSGATKKKPSAQEQEQIALSI